MSNSTKDKKKRPSNFGFYTALVLSIAAVGAAAYYAWGTSQNFTASSASEDSRSVVEAVDEVQSNVPQSEAQESSLSSSEASDVSVFSGAASEADDVQFSAPEAFFPPVEGEVIQAFSGDELVKNDTMNDWRTHNGVDYAATLSEPVKAAAAGTVTAIENDPMLGVVVVIDHGGGYVGYYTGLNETVTVQPGDSVAVSDVIGTVGEAAPLELAMGTHFHFELKLNDSYIDPESVMVRGE